MEKTTTVFIADSAEDFTSGLSAALQRADGFHVLGTAGDGELAIRMIEEKKPDILILDLMLPKKDGIAVLKAISAMERKPIVLATSVFITEYVSNAAANLGVRYLMLKPCDMGLLGSGWRKSGLGRACGFLPPGGRTRTASRPWSQTSSTRLASPPTSRATSI